MGIKELIVRAVVGVTGNALHAPFGNTVPRWAPCFKRNKCISFQKRSLITTNLLSVPTL